ncbi:MAG: hypothetical protein M0Q54_09025 [Pigmentiphaga sp.]|nr:hypothetical protein [Pigmentiphaga sp.]MDY0389273.1 hypothetical protein [Methanolobus sp.]
MSKSVRIEQFLDEVSRDMFGRTRTTSIQNNTCVMCGKNAANFRDELSKKEFTISGICQKCQDEIFTEDE